MMGRNWGNQNKGYDQKALPSWLVRKNAPLMSWTTFIHPLPGHIHVECSREPLKGHDRQVPHLP